MSEQMQVVNIIGAGLSGLSAAIHLAMRGIPSNLVSLQPSERAQSVLAEGGINGALNTMGEDDCPENHKNDTLRAGVYLADPEAVEGLAENAPGMIRYLASLGVPFNTCNGEIMQRNFGGQKKKRTAYAKSSTGKIIMSALIDECRKFEVQGLVNRYPHHEMVQLLIRQETNTCVGVEIRDTYTDACQKLFGPVILGCGGLAGFFPGMTTGTTQNSGDLQAKLFSQGVTFGNLEMIQYHPTTIGIPGKRCLVSEAARGEGGRLYIERDGEKWYFMEELFPEYGNLSPRDVVSRQMYFVLHDDSCGNQVYLDMTGLTKEIWQKRLPDLRAEIMHYLNLDPITTPIPVDPGIHYFMGGIDVDVHHRTNVKGLYAAGECCMQYHGANRLGGNSMLGAVYGGKVAALHLADHMPEAEDVQPDGWEQVDLTPASPAFIRKISEILLKSMGIVRNSSLLSEAIREIDALTSETTNPREKNRLCLAKAMLLSAEFRKESRGAHYREDYPERDDSAGREILALMRGGEPYVAQK